MSTPHSQPINHDEWHPPDTGCPVSPRCIECPAPVCIKEEGGGVRSWRARQRTLKIARQLRAVIIRNPEATLAGAARTIGIPKRKAWKVIASL